MHSRSLLRLSAVAAIAGGLLRAADPAFAGAQLGDATLQQIWFVIDALLLIGVLGIYLSQSAVLGLAGLAGTFVFAVGILLVRSAGVRFFGVGGYETGAAIALVGTSILAAVMLARRTEIAAPSFWLGALLSGLASRAGVSSAVLVAVSGVLFGLGFAVAGANLLRKPNSVEGRAAAAVSSI
jgi:hypothetical protein